MTESKNNIKVSGMASRLAFEGGFCEITDGCGIFVGNENEVDKTPEGWVFINYKTATAEEVQKEINKQLANK